MWSYPKKIIWTKKPFVDEINHKYPIVHKWMECNHTQKNHISLLFMDEIKHGYHEYPIIHKSMKCHHTNRIIISNEIFNANE